MRQKGELLFLVYVTLFSISEAQIFMHFEGTFLSFSIQNLSGLCLRHVFLLFEIKGVVIGFCIPKIFTAVHTYRLFYSFYYYSPVKAIMITSLII